MKTKAVLGVVALFVVTALPCDAGWKVETGRKAFSNFPPVVSQIASVPAKADYQNVIARLQIECFSHPELTELSFGIVLSKAPPNGPMGWRYQYDDRQAVQSGPYSRTIPATNISLGDRSSGEMKGLYGAKRLKLTLLPADGSKWPFEFDVSGSGRAIESIPCKAVTR